MKIKKKKNFNFSSVKTSASLICVTLRDNINFTTSIYGRIVVKCAYCCLKTTKRMIEGSNARA